GQLTRQRWDAHDRLVERTDPLGHTTRWRYDAAGDLTAVEHAGASTTAAYSQLHQAVSVTGPDGARWAAEYDGASNLVAVTDPAGAITRYAFTGGQLSSVTDALGRRQ